MEDAHLTTTSEDAARARIAARLAEIERQEEVRLVFAVESGSRAWGFPSPDSDHDVRFVYVRPLDWYLSVRPGRDVIELPLHDDLDLVGWDLQKALALLLKPNPALVEWLTSPIRYLWQSAFADPLADLAARTAFAGPLRAHYISYARSHWRIYLEGRDEVRLKKYFYVLRPALALAWLRTRASVPPMHLGQLLEGLDLPEAERAAIGELIARKRGLVEAGLTPRDRRLDGLIARELSAAEALPKGDRVIPHLDEANALFREAVHGLWRNVPSA